jgi:hypothetical protein
MEKIFIHKDGYCIVCVKPLSCRKMYGIESEGLCELVLKTSHVACRKRLERKVKLEADIDKHRESLKEKEQELLNLEFIMFREKC